jgi:AcrR family transcriptional regulator
MIQTKTGDPRVKRTRRLIFQAFMGLCMEKGFSTISMQDIAERATVNRGTIYAHFEDKYDLLECSIREGFEEELANKLPLSATLKVDTLRTLIVIVFEHFAVLNSGHCQIEDKQFESLFESTVQQEIYKVLLRWLLQTPDANAQPEIVMDTAAIVMSCAICGTAIRWSRGERKFPVAEMVTQIIKVLTVGLAHLVQVP